MDVAGPVRPWCAAVLPVVRRDGYASAHLDELFESYDESYSVGLGFQCLDELVRAYRPWCVEVRAMYVAVTGMGEVLDLDAPGAAGIAAAWDGFTPPEPYLVRRAPDLVPYVVEEYRRPYPAGTFPAPHGVYHGYYRCHRQDDTVEFTSGVYVEHYPSG
ncbi:hypothetical protein GCM10022243_42910 [Saccharothrix violaceirubra]